MFLSTAQRTSKEEIMDDFSLEGDVLRDALDKIAVINQWLGGNSITLDGIKELIKDWPKEKALSIVDVGCGNGDMCRAVANFAKQEGLTVQILGIDANAYTINHARACSTGYSTIAYAVQNIFDDEFTAADYDIALCTLTLHHFSDKEILYLMGLFAKKARLGVVVNDLQRSALAYRLFQLICFVFRLNDMSREDGLTSILRGFKKPELVSFSEQLRVKTYRVTWRWAFRYQWIIKNI
ncbi:methyltransferase domain-containing protein [Spirosoma radiotolerans]|uniref:Methyltransferase n=1 Tax=Spirosoma radiotolerans TaxID=1379870 RepID=A0A0E3V8K2_9BACT|nr:methyltransferase domain-containing protein [Spirosoma radiotolerans]AKD56381.1 methyltransferase [Spirosoma radiotolerans]